MVINDASTNQTRIMNNTNKRKRGRQIPIINKDYIKKEVDLNLPLPTDTIEQINVILNRKKSLLKQINADLTKEINYCKRIKKDHEGPKTKVRPLTLSHFVFHHITDGETKNGCSICCEEYHVGENVTRIGECGHLHHTECLNQWLNVKKDCPKCRNSIVL